MHKAPSIAVALLTAAMCCGGVVGAQPSGKASPATAPRPSGPSFLTGPPERPGPVVVRARFDLRDINDIDDETETFEFGGVLTLRWHDERQAFDPAQVGVDEKIYQGDFQFNEVFTGWFPQVILVNESGLYDEHGVVLRVQPDGTLTLTRTLDAIGEADLQLRRYPFDRQRLEAVFEVLGFDESEVVFEADSESRGVPQDVVQIPQWTVEEISTSTRNLQAAYAGREGVASVFVVGMEVTRNSMFMVRLVIFPLVLIVMLSWSVFWMDRSSLGDRINVSFIGLLTAVAYQNVVSEILPQISYLTFMNGFLNVSFFLMCMTVVINLMVAGYDKQGKSDVGDRVDRRSRWIFPLTYCVLILLTAGATFTLF